MSNIQTAHFDCHAISDAVDVRCSSVAVFGIFCWIQRQHQTPDHQTSPARLREVLDHYGPVNVVGESFTVYKLTP